ncbi:hypothetical protein [bacterium endosymbiont of Bathymodiolus sp. 5 South]|jgi:hypothetical protein|uniref:hypothetical protein n=1 Tax=bacterium endosymbiont of Bathymodiolus sp. 5 South TaxID=1181670 RepID=UPI0010BC104A|nr:hypothetical protein [bacterium endosymbiont of Bathymodiolus sp. 5 South]CAC9462886.1 hypothetical protein [uncultured Gammaproteobacteria bacterium]SHN92505.1 hypothetical protein BCLUESOX_2591 [bacterium endosymbiont of Bathymodiolus sp. 5 South]VVH56677.1 hypothetical protein BSPCLSOX_2698 [uncultured Gammaproteobacteria bacterium]VVH62000.1 hypothetical protein BSPWISOX_2666 [uncultured Gammaproteobacteria bacterium]VVH64519.1 hypothetical protein BSPLISOX_1653 [uncultured Gammaproteob
MKITKKLIAVLIFTGILSSCATTQSTFKRLESQWVGKDFDRFVLRHGSPYKQFNLNNGDILYTWNSGTSSINIPQSATTNIYGNTASTQFYGGGSIKMYCEIQFQVNSKGFIKKLAILKDTFGMWAPSRCHETLE